MRKDERTTEGGLTAKTGRAVRETQTPCMNQAPANLVGDFLISSKRESEPALWMRWKRKLLGEEFDERGQLYLLSAPRADAGALRDLPLTA